MKIPYWLFTSAEDFFTFSPDVPDVSSPTFCCFLDWATAIGKIYLCAYINFNLHLNEVHSMPKHSHVMRAINKPKEITKIPYKEVMQ